MVDPVEVQSLQPLEPYVRTALAPLTDVERSVIQGRYGLHDGFTRTPEELAAHLGIAADEVLAIESRAIARLRRNPPDPAA